ncbi:Down syndrome cell adhesion molecule-like protein 1 [Strongyloides ratti]|uniref:Down syndrome cell adhesion molecule-like protein 1 n=1 Tax=Strongyloides ratti TaxID=34506 RepID=A0A090LAW1_STRRB|nr:Down syndrome cell adhesion molecule-like protein 1 [Strongyloides ratti]CEF66897.1 Down syndrome cell adhesion molecule-like protein 1 [Strongyloides ratti]
MVSLDRGRPTFAFPDFGKSYSLIFNVLIHKIINSFFIFNMKFISILLLTLYFVNPISSNDLKIHEPIILAHEGFGEPPTIRHDDIDIWESGVLIHQHNETNPLGTSNINMQQLIQDIRRFKRNTGHIASVHQKFNRKGRPKTDEPEVVDIADIRKSFKNSTKSGTGRCVVSADLSSHYCGNVEVSTPPIIPENAGKCIISQKSGREICYPSYTELDTTCTDYNEYPNSVVQPINIPHATVRVLAYFPLTNLQRLIKQYYRQQGKQMPKNLKLGSSYSGKESFLYAKYECNEGYEMIDEVDVMFCYNRQWVRTPPVCRGLNACADNNGGCSHNCRSLDDNNVECSCSKGMVLDQTGKTCIIPVPEVFCRKLANCHCIPIDSTQYSCDCPNRENCLLRKEAPKIYLEPSGPYEVKPGGSINITCYGVGFDYPKLSWHQVGEENSNIKPISGTIKTQQMLEIKNLYKTTDFICSAENNMGIASKQITITVMGPGFAPIIKKISPSRKSITINWDKPIFTSNPITTYTIYYTDKGKKPLKDWEHIEVNEPNHSVTIPNLKPNTKYHIKMRANDVLGPGKLGNSVAINTLKPAKKPEIKIVEGESISVKPLEPFVITCNVTKSDPTPEIVWINKGRPVNKKQKYITSVLHHAGLYEETSFTCEAENEAGKTQKTVHVYVTGPLKPEKIKGKVQGNNIDVNWKPPLITNGPMQNYEILYTDNPSLPEDQWEKISVGSPDINSFTIPNLKEMTPYTIKMRGINDKGEGVISDPIELTTWLAPRPPKVTLTPSEDIERKPSNDDLEHICKTNGVPKPKIVWYWNNEPIEDGKNDFRIYDISLPDDNEESQSKLISEVTTKSGQVKCHAVNNVGEDEAINNVKILGPGSAPLSITPTPKEDGFDVTWEPPALPNGKITNYILYYTKNPDDDLGDWKQMIIPGDKNNVNVVDQDEETNYYVKMQAVNEDGPGLISEAFEVTTGQKHIPLSVSLKLIDPESYEDEGVPITVDPNQTIKFKCYAEGRPTPTVTYSWLSTNNETDSGSQPEPVRIEPVEGNPHTYVSVEISTYTQTKRVLICQARNPDGSQVSRQIVDVKKPGSPPQNIEVELANDNSAVISWKDPRYTNGDLTAYKLYLTPDPSLPLDQWQVIEISDPIANEKNFARGELEPNTKYYVKISAVNENGEGVISDTEQFETGSGAPLDAPYDILSNVKEDNTLDLSWTGPKFPNGPIEGYNIYFVPENVVPDDSDYKEWTKINVPSHDDHGSIIIDKGQYVFAPNTTYLLRISAINDLNEGPASDPVKFETGTGETAPVITLNPPNNRIEVPPMGSVVVECTATGVYKPVVQWLDKDGNKVSDRVLQISNIIKDESYICIAENNVGKVQEILQISVTGPGTPPNEIVGLPIGDKVANIEWATPDLPNGAITGYVVEYSEIGPDGGPTEWKTINVTGPMEQIKLDNLKPKTDYAVKVQAISNRGPGVISEPIRIKTLPTAPEKPETPEVIVHGNNTVEIKLPKVKDPENPDQLINDYVIKYTKDYPPTDDADWKELTYTAPDGPENLVIPIYGENVDPETKYHVKVIPRGEIDGPPSDIVPFETGDGIVRPSIPSLDVTTDEDGTVKLPPGSDYKVRCTSTGHPEPKILWVDEFGNTLSEGELFSIDDIKSSKKFRCIARNQGGEEETPLNIHVMGPGTAPEDIKLASFRPRTIDVSFMPPEITNGNITVYIVYYTPLDDQDPNKEIGQVPSKPIRDWQTYHVTGDNLNEGEQNAKLTGVDPDTSYAVVVQAGNNDGPGPFSSTQTIRTISRARESAPIDLKVMPFSPYSADVEWKNPESMEEEPIGYELFFVPADKKVESEDDRLLDDWEKMTIDGVGTTTKIEDLLKPDTEYVFKIRAIFPDGPGVFSKACISRTLPLGNPPYITTSHGGYGTDGKTTVFLLPGSSYTVFCNATGDPQPEVKWIRGGEHAIDPSTVKANKEHAEWSLRVYNVTTNAEFVCIAQNSLGSAQWNIDIEVLPQQDPDWQKKFVKPILEDGKVKLEFTDELPEYLKNANEWIVLYTEDNTRPIEEWDSISGKGPLESITIPEMDEGKVYFVIVDNPERGIQTPTFTILTPKPPTDIRVGTNINDETVVSFKPAITGDIPVKEYEIKAVNKDDPSEIYFQTIPSGSDTNVVIDSILPGTEYTFTIRGKLENGEVLESAPVDARTSPAGIDCNCKDNQACQLISDSSGTVRTVCYCIEGFVMSKDGINCETTEEYSSVHQDINVTQEPPTTESPIEVENIEGKEEDMSIYPDHEKEEEKTKTDHNIVTVHETDDEKPSLGEKSKEEPQIPIQRIEEYEDEEGTSIRPTDIYGKEVFEIIGPDGKPLPTSSTGRYVNKLGEEIDLDSENRPLDPEGNLLPTKATNQFIYPATDSQNNILPTDTSGIPVYPIVDEDGQLYPTSSTTGARVDKSGKPIPTNMYGEPQSETGQQLPKNEDGVHVYEVYKSEEEPYSTDSYGKIVYPITAPDGTPLQKNEEGRYIDKDGNEIPLNEEGKPIDEENQVLPTTDKGVFIYPVTDEDKILPQEPKSVDSIVGETFTTSIPVEEEIKVTDKSEDDETTKEKEKMDEIKERPDISQTVEPTTKIDYEDDSKTKERFDETSKIPGKETTIIPTDIFGKEVFEVIGPDGQPLPTSSTGRHINKLGEEIDLDSENRPLDPEGNVLPTDDSGKYIYPATDSQNNILPTDITGKAVYPIVNPEGQLYPTSSTTGARIDDSGKPIPTNIYGEPQTETGQTLPINEEGVHVYEVVKPEEQLYSTDSYGKVVYPITSPDGTPLQKNEDGRYIDKDGNEIPLNEEGKPVDEENQVLPTTDKGIYIYPPLSEDKTLPQEPTEDDSDLSREISPPSDKDETKFEGKDQVCANLLKDSSLFFIFETSRASEPIFEKFRTILVDFFVNKLDIKQEKIGLANYGNAVEVLYDIGNYENTEEIKETLMELHFTGGTADPLLALKSVLDILHESNEQTEKVMILFTMTDITGSVKEKFDSLAHLEELRVVIINMNDFVKDSNQNVKLLHKVCSALKDTVKQVTLFTPLYKDYTTTTVSSYTTSVVVQQPEEIGVVGVTEEKVKSCSLNHAKMDIVFAIADNVMHVTDYGNVINSISNLIKKDLDMAPDVTRVSVINYGKSASIPVSLGGYQEKGEIVHILKNTKQSPNLERPDVNILINAAHQQFATFSNQETAKVIILFTNGEDIYRYSYNMDRLPYPVLVITLDEFMQEVKDKKTRAHFIEEWNQLSSDVIKHFIENECKTKFIDYPYAVSKIKTLPTVLPKEETTVSGIEGQKLPYDENETGDILPTDIYGKIIHKIVDIDGKPLPTSSTGRYVNKLGDEIDLDSQDHPLDPSGRVLPQNPSGEYVYPATDEQGNILPVDIYGRPVYPITDENGQLYPTSPSTKARVDHEGKPIPTSYKTGRPISPSGQQLPTDETGTYIYQKPESEEVYTTNVYGKTVYPITYPDGTPLEKNEDGDYITKDGDIIKTDEDGTPIGPDNQPLKKDDKGNYIFTSDIDQQATELPEISSKPLPTDIYGERVYEVIGPDGEPLPTSSTGKHIDKLGEEIQLDSSRRPLGPDGQVLPTDDEGKYVYPATDSQNNILPTDTSGVPVYPIVDSEGQLYPTSRTTGERVDESGKPIPTSAKTGIPVSETGEPLPTDRSGMFIHETTDGDKMLPTNVYGKKVYPIVNEEGMLLEKDDDGNFIDKEGNVIKTNDEGIPIGPDNQLLEKDDKGNYVFKPEVTPDFIGQTLPTDVYGESVHEVIGPDGEPLPTSTTGRYIDKLGKEIPTDSSKRPLGPDGQVLPTDDEGKYVYPATDSQNNILPTDTSGVPVYPIVDSEGQLYPTSRTTGERVDESGKPIPTSAKTGIPVSETGEPLPTDRSGMFIHETTDADKMLPTNVYGKKVYPIVNEEGMLLEKDDDGNFIDKEGNVIKTNDEGIPIGPNNQLLEKDDKGNYIFDKTKYFSTVPPTSLEGHSLPTDKDEIYDEDQTILPTDIYGKTVYEIIDLDGKPLPTSTTGRYINKLGDEIELDSQDRPLDPDGNVLPTRGTDQFVYPATDKDNNILPTDTSGVPVYPIVNADGQLYPTSETTGARIDETGKPIPTVEITGIPVSESGQALPTEESGVFVYETPTSGEAFTTNAYGKIVYPIVNEDGVLLNKNEDGDFVDENGDTIETTEDGIPLGPDKKPLMKNEKGNYVYTPEIKPDISGGSVHEIIGPDGEPLPTSSTGKYIDKLGEEIQLDSSRRPLGPDGQVLPTDDEGKYVYPATDSQNNILPTDTSGVPVYPIVDSEGQLYPTSRTTGERVDESGKPIPTSAKTGIPVSETGEPLPTDRSGMFIHETTDGDKMLPTNVYGKKVYPIVNKEGMLLEKDDDGNFIDKEGNVIKTNDEGIPIGPDNQLLEKDDKGNYVFKPEVTPDFIGQTLPTDVYGESVHEVIGPDGEPLPTSTTGRYIDKLGKEIPTDSSKRPLGPDGQVLPTNDEGKYVYPATDSQNNILPTDTSGVPVYPIVDSEGQLYPTSRTTGERVDESGKPIPTSAKTGIPVSETGEPLPTDRSGMFIHETTDADKMLPTNVYGKKVYPIVNEEGMLLEKDDDGNFIDKEGNVIKTNDEGIPIGPDNQLLEKDDKGNYIFDKTKYFSTVPSTSLEGHSLPTDKDEIYDEDQTILPTDIYGRTVYEIIDLDGKPLPTSTTGRYINKLGDEIELDSQDRPLDPDGNVLPTRATNQFVYPATDSENNILPTDTSGVPVYPIVNADGQLYPTSETTGARIDETGKPIPTVEITGIPVSESGQTLPTEETGVFVYETSTSGEAFTTNAYGKIVYPIVNEDGVLLPRNEDGDFVDETGNLIKTAEDGTPIGPDNQPLEKDSQGNYIFRPETLLDSSGKVLPTDVYGEKVYEVIGPDGQPLPTSSTGRHINVLGEEIPTDSSNRPLGPDGQLLPTDSTGKYVYPATDSQNNVLPTDTSGIPVYPIVDEDGQLYPTSSTTGARVDKSGQPIPTSENTGIPVDKSGKPLPTEEVGTYVYETTSKKGIIPTNVYGKKVYPIIDEEGMLLEKDKDGNFIDKEGNVIKTNDEGIPIGPDNQLLEKDDKGNYILKEDIVFKTLPTDVYGEKVYEVIGPDGQPLPTSTTGRYIDKLGEEIQLDSRRRPLGPDGQVLPTNDEGKYVYPATDSQNNILPTDTSGVPVYPIVDSEGQLYPTSRTTGERVDESGKPIPTSAKTGIPVSETGEPLPTDRSGMFIHETTDADKMLPTNVYGKKVYPIVNEEGMLLEKDDDGNFIDKEGNVIKTNDEGIPIGPDNQLLEKDDKGNYVYKSEILTHRTESPYLVGQTLPTDVYGDTIYEIIGPDGQPLPTSSTGRHINKLGNEIPLDSKDRPLGPDGQLLPTDSTGKYIYPATDSQNNVLPTDTSGIPVYPIVDEDGQLYPTSSTTGARVDKSGQPIPTSENTGIPVDKSGKPLPTEEIGTYIYEKEDQTILPTDIYGKTVFEIIDLDGKPLPTSTTGRYINKLGDEIELDSQDRPLDPDGNVLPTRGTDQFVYPATDKDNNILPTDTSGVPVYPIVNADGQLYPTSRTTGARIDETGKPIPTVEITGIPVSETGQTLPTEESGVFVYETSTSGEAFTTNAYGKIVYPIVNEEGRFLPKNDDGEYVDEKGDAIRTTDDGIPLGPDGNTLKKDDKGNYIYVPTSSLVNTTQQPIFIISPMGEQLQKDENGNYINSNGEIIKFNEDMKPLDPNDEVLPTSESGSYIYPYVDESGQILPTDLSKKPIYKIIDPEGKPLSQDSDGRYIDDDNKPIPTSSTGIPLRKTGEPLPKDKFGNFIYDASFGGDILPTDKSLQIVDHLGEPLRRDETGTVFIDSKGTPINTDDQGRPLSPDGSVLPTNSLGQYYIEEVKDYDSILKPTTTSSLSKDYNILSYDNTPLKKDPKTDQFFNPIGQLIPINDNFEPLDPNGNILKKNDDGMYIYPAIGPNGEILELSDNGIPIYPVTDIHGDIMPTTSGKLFTDHGGNIIPTSETGIPLGINGLPLPVGDKGYHIMIGPVNRTSSHCYVDSYINLLIIYDASNDIKVLDYRLLKELAKNFLVEHFNLDINRVRVGLLKYGENAEVTISFGDYDNEAQLLLKLGEARRLKGENNLYNALNQAIGEFIIEQNEKVPHVAIIFKNGKSSSDITVPAKQLRENTKTNIYVVSNNGDKNEDLALVGEGNEKRIISVNGWKNTKSTDLGVIADDICKYAPKISKQKEEEDIPWPTRKPSYTVSPIFSKQKICDKIDFGLDFIIVLDASDNVDVNAYEKIKDGLGTFIDEYLDMSPDVVRVGFIQYSDKVNIPISLGHYQDKEEILLVLKDLEKETGIPIALKGFDAARVQLSEHRRKEVPNVILLVTTGKNRGNAIGAAYDLRETYGSQIFALAINPDSDQLNSLKRIVGKEYAHERLLTIDNVDELHGQGLNKISKALCGNIMLKDEIDSTLKSHTTKRSTDNMIDENNIVTKVPSIRTTRSLKPVPLCKDGIIRPFFFSLVIDTTSRSEIKDFKNTMKSLINFFNTKFEATPLMAVTNLITVNSNGVTNKKLELDLESLVHELSKITQSSNDFSSPKLGLAIDEATIEAAKNAISGTTKVMLVISSDGTSSDDPLPSAEYATDDFLHNIVSISLRNPSSDLLTKISGNSPTRVIHLSEWENIEELFTSWTSFAICEAINVKTKDKKKIIPKEDKVSKIKEDKPSRISVVGVTPNSLSVSWICCTNDKQKYIIKYSPDVTIPFKNWQSLNATCKDGFGKQITDLPTDSNYYVCVFTNDKVKNSDIKYNSENCDFVHLDKNTIAPDDFEHSLDNTIPDKCKCRCDNEGEVTAPSPCDLQQYEQTFSPIDTIPQNMKSDDCPCRIKSYRGLCPTGYYYNRGQCYDVNECLQQNGGCSHGCVNTPGDFYCACPHGMTRDPADHKKCISINSSFDRITEMLAQYLHGNAQLATMNGLMNQNGVINKSKPIKYKTIIESEDKSKKITFEWSQMPTMVKKALKWLL